MWEISENLHRSDLDRIQRALHEAEWIKLDEESGLQSGQLDPIEKSKRADGRGHRPESGIRKAARELPIKGDTEEARRAGVSRQTVNNWRHRAGHRKAHCRNPGIENEGHMLHEFGGAGQGAPVVRAAA